jgi:hypothetical protein
MIPFTPPGFGLPAFNCPHCNAFANQEWFGVCRMQQNGHYGLTQGIDISICAFCKQYSVWHQKRMLFPSGGTAPLPNPDLPEDIKSDYEEARSILSLSPRGSTALLRLAIQKLCKHLNENGENLNDDIANLVKKGLPQKIQRDNYLVYSTLSLK